MLFKQRNSRMKAFLFVLSLFAGLELFSAHDLTGIWESYKSLHGKSYESAKEETFRQKIWTENVAFIQKHNLEYDLGLHTYTVGLNQFSDWTTHEYGRYMLGARPSNATTTFNLHQAGNPSNLPSQIDWRKYGYVTPVKNQGQCGSCWAFSSTGSLEGQTFRKYGQLISLSEQNLVDCTRDYGNRGCNGGWMYNAFKYIINNNGLDREECYPYEGKDLACRYKPSCTGAYVTNYVNVAKGSEPSLQDAVGTVGPVSVAIDANHPSFMQYKSGVFYEPKCSSTTSDHAVLVVGYGREDGNDYWLVKNSWSASWGEQGYIKMSRNRDNNCAIATYATYPVV